MSERVFEQLLGQIPISQLAGQLGVSEDEASQAVRTALPALLGGMEANAQDPAGAASLAKALGQHDGSLLEGGSGDGGGGGGLGGLGDVLGGLLGGGKR